MVAVRDPDDGTHLAVKYIAADQKRAKQSEIAAVSALCTPCRTASPQSQNPQLRRLDNSHPHVVHTHGMLRGASGSVYIMQERAVCDLHDAAGACGGRVMGEGDHIKEWMLQVAHGELLSPNKRVKVYLIALFGVLLWCVSGAPAGSTAGGKLHIQARCSVYTAHC